MRIFQRYVHSSCFEPLYIILARFKVDMGQQIRLRTAQRYMKVLKLDKFIAVQKPFLAVESIASRIVRARKHESWTQSQWSNVMFTDESSFTARPMKNYLHIWRRKGSRLNHKYTVSTFKSGYQNVSVWTGFSLRGLSSLVDVIESFYSKTYRVAIDSHILLFMYKVQGGTNDFALQEENCGPHRAKNCCLLKE